LPALVAPGGACLVWRQDRGSHSCLSSELPERRHKGAKCPRQRPGIEELLTELCTNQRRSVNRVPRSRTAKPLTLTQEGLYLLNRTVTGWIEEELALGNGEGVAPLRVLPHLLSSAGGDQDCCSLNPVERAPGTQSPACLCRCGCSAVCRFSSAALY